MSFSLLGRSPGLGLIKAVTDRGSQQSTPNQAGAIPLISSGRHLMAGARKRQSVRASAVTDMAARGLDIDQLPHVVDFGLSHNPEDYVYRVGRIGRGGRSGTAISLVCAEERGQFGAIQRQLNTDIHSAVLSGFEPDPDPVQAVQPQRRDKRIRPRQGSGAHRCVPEGRSVDGKRARRRGVSTSNA